MQTYRKPNGRLEGLEPYDPKYLPAECMMSANENPSNIDEDIQIQIRKRMKSLQFNRYPDPLANKLRTAIANANGLEKENILIGNGGDELLFNFALAWGGPGRKFLNVPPTFSVYENNALLTGTEVVNIPRKEDFSIDQEAVLERVAQGDIDYIIITSPNNPTGQLADEGFISTLLSSTDALVMVDEAYGEFSRTTMRPFLALHKNLVLLRTVSKAFALAGVRLGYILAHEDVIREFIKVRQPYSVDAISQMVGLTVFENRARFSNDIADIIDGRDYLFGRLSEMEELTVFPSDSNFILVRVDDAHGMWEGLYKRGVLVRDFSHSAGLENCLRISVGTPEENEKLISAIQAVLKERRFGDGF